jgi:predicted enzyme related to lactoylglutathione lyase
MNLVLPVGDLQASCRFYREALGLTLEEVTGEDPAAPGSARPMWVAFDEKKRPTLCLRQVSPAPSAQLEIGLGVEDLKRAHARAEAGGAAILHPPRKERWGRTARYRDPDGNVVALTEQLPEPIRPGTLVKGALFAAALFAALWVAWYGWVVSGLG